VNFSQSWQETPHSCQLANTLSLAVYAAAADAAAIANHETGVRAHNLAETYLSKLFATSI